MTKATKLFIGGAGRSGTTLVQKVLLAHPKIAGGAEFYYTKPIFELHQKMLKSCKNEVFHPSINESFITEKIKEFYDHFFVPFITSETQYISEKTPTNIEVANVLLETYKEAKFIHVYRDGRAVLNSHFQVKKRAWKTGKNLTEINLVRTSIYWRKCISMGNGIKSKFKNRVFSICYEDMIQHPKETFDKVFNFLQIEAHDQVDQVDKIKLKEEKSDAHINNIWYTKEMYEKAYDPTRVNQWRKELTSFRKFVGSAIMFEELNSMGYKTTNYHRIACNVFYFFFNIKARMKKLKILYPLIHLKRKLQ